MSKKPKPATAGTKIGIVDEVATVFQVEAVSREERLERFVEWLRCFAPLVPTAGDRRKILMGAIEELGPRPVGEKSNQREGDEA